MLRSNDRELNWIAMTAIWFWILAVLSGVLFGLFVIVGIDIGYLAVGTMILFHLSFFCGILGGVIVLIRHKTQYGPIYSIIAIVLSAPAIIFSYEVKLHIKAREEAESANTGSRNIHVLANSLFDYADAHGGYLPDPNNWCDELSRFNPKLTTETFKHPAPQYLSLKGSCQFGFNRLLWKRPIKEISPNVVLLCEADGPWNLNGGPEMLKTRYLEHNYITVILADGSVVNYEFDNEEK